MQWTVRRLVRYRFRRGIEETPVFDADCIYHQIQIEELEEIIENSICQNKDKRRGKKESGVALYDIKGLHSGYCRFAHIKSTGCD